MSTKKSHIKGHDLKKIGQRLSLLRKRVAPNQAKFAESLGISANFVSDLERGKTGPSMTLLMLIESRYAITPHQILTGDGFSPENIGAKFRIYPRIEQSPEPYIPDAPATIKFTDTLLTILNDVNRLKRRVSKLEKQHPDNRHMHEVEKR